MAAVSSIIAEAATRLNEVSADETTTYTKWLNLCTYDIEQRFPDAPFLEISADHTLSAGTRSYMLSAVMSNFRKMLDVTIPSQDVKLQWVPGEQFDLLQPSATESGVPTIYTLRPNDTIEFYPSPGSGYTVHYNALKTATGVSAISATPSDVPARYHELYHLFITKRGYERRGQFNQARAVNAEYEILVERMKQDLKKRTEEMQRMKDVREFHRGVRSYGDEIINLFWKKS